MQYRIYQERQGDGSDCGNQYAIKKQTENTTNTTATHNKTQSLRKAS